MSSDGFDRSDIGMIVIRLLPRVHVCKAITTAMPPLKDYKIRRDRVLSYDIRRPRTYSTATREITAKTRISRFYYACFESGDLT